MEKIVYYRLIRLKLLVLRVKLTREKEGIDLENAEIRNLLDSMQEQVTSFRGSL